MKEPEREKKRERERKATDKKARDALKVKLKVPASSVASSDALPAAIHDPLLIPLPTSRAASPFPHVSPAPTTPLPAVGTHQRHPLSAPTSSASSGELRAHARQAHLQAGTSAARAQYRSPKRTFDESSASGGEDADGREGREKRSRTRAGSEAVAGGHDMDVDVDGEAEASPDTPGLSAPGTSSSSEMSSEASDGTPSTSPSPAPEVAPVPVPPVSASAPKALTRRQRKALGLPKPRSALGPPGASAGKIVIPGGRWTGRPMPTAATADAEADEEWRRNGTGRLDVRGFRELKI